MITEKEMRFALEAMVAAFDTRPEGGLPSVTETTQQAALAIAKTTLGWADATKGPADMTGWWNEDWDKFAANFPGMKALANTHHNGWFIGFLRGFSAGLKMKITK